MFFGLLGTRLRMSRQKPGWTEPGAVADQAEEARKGTAAAHPVLSLAPEPAAPARRPSAASARRSASGGSAEGAEQAPDTRSPAEIEAEIERTRARLAGTLDELAERLSPRAVLRRADSSMRGVFVAPDGSLRKDRAALAVGALVSAVGGAVALRRSRR
jgi:hypothetical protein